MLAYAAAWALWADAPLVFFACLASPLIEAMAKELVARGRPRDEREWGLPSGDCMIATAFWPHVLGVYAAPLLAVVAIARMVRGAHWPLDVLTGCALGAAFWVLAA